jgi:hypothetical protein
MAAQRLVAVTFALLTANAAAQSMSGSSSGSWGSTSQLVTDTSSPSPTPSPQQQAVDAAKTQKASQVEVTLTLNIPTATVSKILSNTTVLTAFKTNFAADIAAKLSVSASQVNVTSVAAGSLVVKFDVKAATPGAQLPDVETQLSTAITFTNIKGDATLASAVGTTFDSPTITVATVYTSNACSSAAVCGSYATCSNLRTGFQCTCTTGYGTTPAANVGASCTLNSVNLDKSSAVQAGIVTTAALVSAVSLFM